MNIFKYAYYTLMYNIKYKLWYIWHCRLRDLYGGDYYIMDNRPCWHMCCNGNAGGWRTRFCDWLEDYNTGWRYYEYMLENYSTRGVKTW